MVDPIATRYASTFFELVKAEGRLDETLGQLKELGEALGRHPDLRQFLLNPDVEAAQKLGVLDRVLGGEWSEALRAFLRMVLAMGRAEALVDIVEGFRELVDAERRRVRVVVRTARPLSASLKDRLKRRLAHLEHREVELAEEMAPELLGGIQVVVDHQMLDGSLKGRLTELRRRLKSIRVH